MMRKYKVVNKRRFYSFIIFVIALITLAAIYLVDIATSYADTYDPDGYYEFVVKEGDTLWDIAKDTKPNGTDTRYVIEQIKRFNNLKTSTIRVNTVIKVPKN